MVTVPAIDIDRDEIEATTWTQTNEQILIDIMLEHVKKGNRPTSTFIRTAWKEIHKEFFQRTKRRYTREQFKNKYNGLRKKYREFKKLIEKESGFGWNPITKNVTAEDDTWDNYIKVNSNARKLCKSGCPMYEELRIIYDDTSAEGKLAFSNTMCPPPSDDEFHLEDTNTMVGSTSNDVEGDDTFDDAPQIDRRRHYKDVPSSGKRRKESRTTELSDSLCILAEASMVRANALNRLVPKYIIVECIKCLEKMEGWTPEAYIKAIEKFQSFMEMSVEGKTI